jgi:O-antigen/teichoic acid export membrane protein
MIKHIHKTGAYLREILFTNISARQTILKNSLWLLLADVISKGMLFLVTIFIARSYSLEEYGLFGFIFSLMTLIALAADFGLKNITIRELAKRRLESESFFDHALSFKILLTGVACILMITASFFLERDIRLVSLLAGVAILLEGLADYVRTTFRVAEHMQYEAVIKAATSVVLIGLVICVIAMKLSLLFILFGYILANLFGLLLSLRILPRKFIFSLNTVSIRRLMHESWPLFLGLICTTAFGHIDLVLIKVFRGGEEAGLYQAAYKLLFAFQLIGVVHMAMYPRLASLYAEGNEIGYRKIMTTSLVSSLFFLIPLGLAITFYSTAVIRLVFGQQYVNAAAALPLLIWSGAMAFINGFFAYTLIISGRQKLWLISVFFALASLVIIEIILIPRIGFFGAAVATFVGELIDLVFVLVTVFSSVQLRKLFIDQQ